MRRSHLIVAIAMLATVGLAAPAQAQRHGGGSAGAGRAVPRQGGAVGHAVPRGTVPVRPLVTGPYRSYGHAPYRYYYPYGGFGLGLNYGYPFRYLGFGHLGLGYPGYGYPGYGYRYGYGGYGYGGYGYGGYGYGGYGYGYPGYITAAPGRPYGRIRILDAPRQAEVLVDGYYVGIVDDFDGAFQRLNLEAAVHHIEIRAPGFETLALDLNVQPGRTVTYSARMRRQQP